MTMTTPGCAHARTTTTRGYTVCVDCGTCLEPVYTDWRPHIRAGFDNAFLWTSRSMTGYINLARRQHTRCQGCGESLLRHPGTRRWCPQCSVLLRRWYQVLGAGHGWSEGIRRLRAGMLPPPRVQTITCLLCGRTKPKYWRGRIPRFCSTTCLRAWERLSKHRKSGNGREYHRAHLYRFAGGACIMTPRRYTQRRLDEGYITHVCSGDIDHVRAEVARLRAAGVVVHAPAFTSQEGDV